MNIDFVEPTLPGRPAWILASVPLVLALVLGGVQMYLQERVQTQRQQQASAALAAKAKPLPVAARRPPPPYQREALAAIKRAALPEADALAQLEQVEVTGIQLRSIDVNPAQSIVLVELDAASDEALADYLDQLNAGDAPLAWHIQKLAARSREPSVNGGTGNLSAPSTDGHVVSIARSL